MLRLVGKEQMAGGRQMPVREIDQDKVQDPSELVEIVNDLYRRLTALEVAAKMARQPKTR